MPHNNKRIKYISVWSGMLYEVLLFNKLSHWLLLQDLVYYHLQVIYVKIRAQSNGAVQEVSQFKVGWGMPGASAWGPRPLSLVWLPTFSIVCILGQK